MFSASTIAAASIAASLNGMNWHMRTGIDLLQRLAALTGGQQVRALYRYNDYELVLVERLRHMPGTSFRIQPVSENMTLIVC